MQIQHSAHNHPDIKSGYNDVIEVNKVAADAYDTETTASGWDSPGRAQRLVGRYIHEGSIVLDIGIGTGQAVQGYTEKGATVIGLDHDLDMLAAAESLTGESGLMRLADINGRLPLKDLAGRVDVAQAIGVLEFAEDLNDVFEQVKQTLMPQGVFVFTVETVINTFEEPALQYADLKINRHTPYEIRQILREKGLTLLHDEAYGGYVRGDTATDKVPYHIFLAQNQN